MLCAGPGPDATIAFHMSLPSKTSLYVAAGRALGARDPDPAVRNPDYLAERLLGPAERALVSDQACVQALEQEYAQSSKNMEAMSSALMMQIRTRFIDDKLAEALRNGAKQLVILGSGFDTRPYRLTDLLQHVRVFEVDQPSTQEYKRRRIQEAGIAAPPNLTYVAVDFRHGELDDALRAAGYDPSLMTFFIWEGVTMYLPETAVEDNLKWLAAQAPGSSIVFDFVYRAVLDQIAFISKLPPEQLPEQARQAITRILNLESGEPWIFGIPAGQETEFLAKFGLTMRELLPVGGEESRQRYLMRSDGSFYMELPPGAQRPAAGAGANAAYCLAEATV
jgi:methyltransferase (TIGR00027 family)